MFRLLLILALLFPLPVLAAPQLGSLRVRVSDDFTSRSASVNYLLRTALSNFVSLPASLFDDVEIVPGGMYSYDPDAQSLVLEDSDDLNSSAETQFSTLTLRVNFQNKDVSCSEDKLSNILQESKRNVSDWFSEASYGSDFFQFDSDSS
ncbi:MAG: hypothetical protein KDD64_16690, partial [Bdellovibrionales bacterium]|nr:hypothetical protein [Bdellovibrionales bacterium]